MVAREPENAIISANRPMVNGRQVVPARQLLTIHFVRKEGNAVVGLLDPYIDPDCARQAHIWNSAPLQQVCLSLFLSV